MEDRFILAHKEGYPLGIRERILIDRRTGVNYLWVSEGYAGGLTVLLDREGKPIISYVGENGVE